MRIVSGKYRRRKLLTNPGQVTRPMPDRVKEFLFHHLLDDLAGRRLADVFSGTGTIGLEGLSRGASSAVFIEKDRQAHELLKRNVATLGVENETLCWRTDALRSSFCPKGADDLVPFQIVFVDPPYQMISKLRHESRLYKSLERLARPNVTEAGARLVLRTPGKAMFDCPGVWQFDQKFEISHMEIHLFHKCGSGSLERWQQTGQNMK